MGNTNFELNKKDGKERAEIERNLLILLFNGFSELELRRGSYSKVAMINHECLLKRYAELSDIHIRDEYIELSDEGKQFYYLITALDSMCSRGLMAKRAWFVDNFSPDDGVVDLYGKLDGSEGSSPDWIARAIIDEGHNSLSYEKQYSGAGQIRKDTYKFYSLKYELTEKGYDVALIIQNRADEKAQFEQQADLQRKAIEASESSAKSAEASRRIATLGVIAAYIIGASSLFNVIFQVVRAVCY